MRYYKCALRDL